MWFSIRLEATGEAEPVVESRIVGGSGQRHRIRASGAELVDEGFV